MRIGLAGLGVHGIRYAEHLLRGEIEGAELVAVSRSDTLSGARFAQENGLAFVADPCELAAHPNVDALIAVLPPDLHPPVARAALSAGKPSLIEKPLAPDGASAHAIAAEVERTGTPLMVGQTLRFDPLVERIRQLAPELGPLRTISINQRFEPSDRPWLDRPGAGGIQLNTGVHGADLMRHLTGLEPASVLAESQRAETEKTDDGFLAVVRLEPGGVLASLDNTRATRSRSGRIELVGERGQLWGDHIHRTLQRVADRKIESEERIPAAPTIPRTLAAFVGALRADAPFPVTARDGAVAVEIVEAATRSAERGERVAVGTPSTSTPDGFGCRD